MTTRATIEGMSALVEGSAAADSPPLLFVHGYFGRGLAFEPLMSDLAHRGYSCWAPDLRGHGETPTDIPLGKVSVQDYADDIARVARQLGSPVIIGHSMGGLIAQLVAARGLARALVLLAPAPPRGIPVLSLRLAIAQVRYMPSILLSRVVCPGRADLKALVVNRVPEHEQDVVLDMLVPDSGRAGCEMSILGVPVPREAITVPVLVISGDQDRFIPLSRSRLVAERYGADLHVAPGRGHMLIIEPGFEQLSERIDQWLRTKVVDQQRRISA
jgi:pimeloyl-ACP methyl ester carboxylesterase